MTSLRTRLFIGLALLIAITGSAAGVFAYRWAFNEAIELQDGILRQIGVLAANNHFTAPPAARIDVDAEAKVVVAELDKMESLHHFSPSLPDGMQTVASEGRDWRVLVLTRNDGSRAAIAQPTASREEIARDSALRSVVPLAALLPLLMILIAVVIGRTFRPVSRLSARLDHKHADDLNPLPIEGIASELQPFIRSINSLLSRLDRQFERQRRFISDAAHELRSPITALSLQIENLDQATSKSDSATRLAAVKGGIQRMGRLISQLLTLARYEVLGPQATSTAWLDVAAKEAMAQHMPAAIERNIDFGLNYTAHECARATPEDLAAILNNLVDNAIRHAPLGGRVDLSVTREGNLVEISVQDNGEGISDSDLPHIFERFYRGNRPRGEGTGLGLSIVKEIATRLGGSVSLQNIASDGTTGLRVAVRLRRADGMPASTSKQS